MWGSGERDVPPPGERRAALDAQREQWERALGERADRFGAEASASARAAADVFSRAGTQRLLELGGGQGRDTLFFAERGFEVHSLDYAQSAVDAIRGKTELADWRYHAFISDRPESLAQVEADHRRHAQIELAIRDLKQGSGLNHAPSGHFFANAAWLLVASLAHNLARWIARLGLGVHGPIVTQTLRRRYLTLPGRITRSGRRSTLHLPARWPWRHAFTQALQRLQAIPLLA